MLAPAHAGHLGLVRNLIRQGAIEGSFDAELAINSPETELFFANLRQALLAGYFVEAGRGGELVTLAAPGYVYAPDDGDRRQPIGFGLFKSMGDLGYELWLTGMDPQWRGRGHGRAMITGLLATPAGRWPMSSGSNAAGRAARDAAPARVARLHRHARHDLRALVRPRRRAPRSLRTHSPRHADRHDVALIPNARTATPLTGQPQPPVSPSHRAARRGASVTATPSGRTRCSSLRTSVTSPCCAR